MADQKYKPKPLDVELSTELLALREQIARRVHDAWAHAKMGQGFTLGATPDNEKKEHPDLIPYDQLDEASKDLDRHTVEETMKALLLVGAKITVADQIPRYATAVECASDADAALKDGHAIKAYEIIREGLKHWKDSHRLNQVLARALQQSGDLKRARDLLRRLSRDKRCDKKTLAETFGLRASTSKMLAMRASGAAAAQHADDALDCYERGFETAMNGTPVDLDGALYNGINVATLQLIAGEKEKASAVATKVAEICHLRLAQLEAEAEADRDPDPVKRAVNAKRRAGLAFWSKATLGEAALVQGEWEEAEQHYKEAGEHARRHKLYGALRAPKKQARWLLKHLGRDSTSILEHLRGPGVLVVHAPAGEIENIRGFPRRLRSMDPQPQYIYCSAAPGAEMEIVQQMIELGGKPEIHVVLPCPRDEYREAFRDPDNRWAEEFDVLLDQIENRQPDAEMAKESDIVEVGVKRGLNHRHALDYAARITLGRAKLHARGLETSLTILAAPGCGEIWKDAEELRINWIRRSKPPRVDEAREPHELMAILFADAVKFSALDEGQLPLFVRHFLGGVAVALARTGCEPVVKNTWGDGLYFVFHSVAEAGRVALALADFVNREKWERHGLPMEMNVRIALHAGPTYVTRDPVTGRENVMGTHVSRAARIEPITPPGQVYASSQFAALAEIERVGDFVCDYVGKMQLAKQYGEMGVYHVRAPA